MAEDASRAYSEELLEHFRRPRNVGSLADPDGVGKVGDPACGDFLEVSIRVSGNRLAEVRFRCRGCPAAIACASKLTELATGLDLDEASEITDEAVAAAVGGLPAAKLHCSSLAASALHEAILDHVVRAVAAEARSRRSAAP
ncbi:MAG: iron-sulfur cluster assembly scaffold protein [Candidatus Brocadiia bacterium]